MDWKEFYFDQNEVVFGVFFPLLFRFTHKDRTAKTHITKTLPKMDSNRIKQTKTDTKKAWLSY
ncbi:MAG: hypothetical protein ACW99F_14530 [Candidatus Hodarchaeales archaeon]